MGRPREFDTDQALDQAMEAFWEHGFEATSLVDLMKATGLQKGSIYKAFGDKHSLFLEVLVRYLEGMLEKVREGFAQAASPAEGVRTWLHALRSEAQAGDCRKGCLAVNTIVELAPHDEEVDAVLTRHFLRVTDLLLGVIREGQEAGQFRTDATAGSLARYLGLFAMGSAASARASFPSGPEDELTELVLSVLEKP